MITANPKLLLYVEPQNPKLEKTVEDELTAKMRGWMKLAKEGPRYHGVHTNPDGYSSQSCDYMLPTGHQTHSLCVHYLANHRSEIPEAELEKVKRLPSPGFTLDTCIPKDPTEKIKFYGDPMIDMEILKCALGKLNVLLHQKGEDKPTRQKGMAELRKPWQKAIRGPAIPNAASMDELEAQWRAGLVPPVAR